MPKGIVQLNMRQLRKSRPKLRVGDIFTFLMPDDLYRFGRVIRTDAIAGGFTNSILIYVYDVTSSTMDSIPELSRDRLLIPPCGTNQQAWLKGFFVNVSHKPLNAEDCFPVHCFWSLARRIYLDDNGNKLDKKHEPCGLYGLESYRTIDDAISKALGIPVAPD